MLQYIPQSQIDFHKYNDCVSNSYVPILYAESWYLDIVAKHWDILMYDDYQAVMPIPFSRMKRSFWKESIVQPYFAQQLGILSKEKLDKEIYQEFYQRLQELMPAAYNFNHSQYADLKDNNLKSRTNFILHLNSPYQELFGKFSTSKRQGVRKAKNNGLIISQENNVQKFMEFQFAHMPLKESSSIIEQKKQILSYAMQHDLGEMHVVRIENELLAMAFFIRYRNRMYYVQSASSGKGRELQAMDFIFNHIIEINAESKMILDFEGSEVPGISKFMERFGAINEPFKVLSN